MSLPSLPPSHPPETLGKQLSYFMQEDCQLNMARKAATKKLQMLPTVVSHLKK